MKKQIIFITIALSFVIQAQDYPPPTDLITIPTAGTLSRGSFSMDMRIQDEGGLITGLSVGITDRFQFGLSYGSPNLIGDDSLVWYPRPEAKLKYLVIDENISMPGIAFGMNTQGLGQYYSEDTLQRYDTKALGIYLAASKNWLSPFGNGNIGLHSGLNYSFLETNDGDEDLNLFFGLDLELNPEFSILLEYNSALNENDMTAETMSLLSYHSRSMHYYIQEE